LYGYFYFQKRCCLCFLSSPFVLAAVYPIVFLYRLGLVPIFGVAVAGMLFVMVWLAWLAGGLMFLCCVAGQLYGVMM